MYIYIYVCMHIYIYIYIHICVYIYIYIYIHMYIYNYTHTTIRGARWPGGAAPGWPRWRLCDNKIWDSCIILD